MKYPGSHTRLTRLTILCFLMLLVPSDLWAHNCSGLRDCFGSARAALAASVGLGLFLTMLSVGLDFIPIVGDVKGVVEGVTGRDLITGQRLSPMERAMGAIPFAGRFARAAGGLAAVARAARRGERMVDASRAMGRAHRIGDAARAAGRGQRVTNTGRSVNRASSASGTNRLTKKKCKSGFEPVDLLQGIVFYEGVDFELPGPLPLKWERTWYSDSDYEGILGHGTHCNFDSRVHIFPEQEEIVVVLPDGRITEFSILETGQEEFNRSERLTLKNTGEEYQLHMHDDQLVYYYQKIGEAGYRLFGIQNLLGFTIRLQYENTRLVLIADSTGRQLNIENDSEGRVVQVSLKETDGHVFVSYDYNEEGDLCGITDNLGQTTTIDYKNHLMLSKTDRNGQIFYWEYDADGTGARCIHTWGDGGLLEGWIAYYPEKGYNIVTNSLKEKMIYHYSQDFLCTKIIDALDNTFEVFHNEFGEVIQEIDELGAATNYEYDMRGNLSALIAPDGNRKEYIYNDQDMLLTAVDAEGYVDHWKYDNQNRIVQHMLADGSAISLEYNNLNLVSVIQEGDGRISKLSYDDRLNLKSMDLPNGSKSSWSYNLKGEIVQAQNPQGGIQNFDYDGLGRITCVQHADGNSVQFKYNAYDEVIWAKDKFREVKFKYNPLGSICEQEENDVKIQFIYDSENQLVQIKNGNNGVHVIRRDANGEVIEEIGFDGITKRFQRDAVGKVVRVERPGNLWTEFEYSAYGKVTRVEYSDGNWETYGYDKRGWLVEAVNPQISVHFKRDSIGRIIEEKQGDHIVFSSYADNGKRNAIKSSLGYQMELTHNNLGYVTRATAQYHGFNGELNSPRNWTADIKRNHMGLETERYAPGGVTSSRKYDVLGRQIEHIVQNQQATMLHSGYHWEPNYRLQSLVNQLTQGTTNFSHNIFGDLTWAQHDDGTYEYKMPDNAGNLYRTKEQNDCTYGDHGRLMTDSEFTYDYDEEGNLVQKSNDSIVWEYRWYSNGLLKEVLKNGKATALFEYDALGRRTAKITSNDDEVKVIERILWDANVMLHEWSYLLEDRPKWGIGKSGVLMPDKKEPIPDSLISWVFDEDSFIPAAKITKDNAFSIISNHQGAPCQMYDSEGKLIWEVEYDLYGKIKNVKVGRAQDCPFRLQGQYEDAEIELYYNRYRYYSPYSGTYISQDPLGVMGNNPNFYAYVKDSNFWLDPLALYTYYQLFDAAGKIVYHGITDRHIQERLLEHAADGKKFSAVKALESLSSRAKARNLEGSALFHAAQRGDALFNTPRRASPGFYHGYDDVRHSNMKGRKFLSQKEINKQMRGVKKHKVDSSGRLKSKMKCK